MKFLLLCGLLTGFCVTALTQQAGKTDTIVFTKFPKEQALGFETVFPLKQDFVRRIFLTDSSLITWSLNEDRGFFFRPFSLNGKPRPEGYIRSGGGTGKIAAPLSGGYHKGHFWLFDIAANKLVTAQPQKTGSGRDTVILKEYAIPDFYYSMALTDSQQVLGSGLYDAKYKLARISLQTGKTLSTYGSFNNPPADIPFNSWKESFQSFLFTHPDKEVAVLACRYADQVEFINQFTGNSRILKGPENHAPQYNPFYSAGRDMIERTADTRFAFVNGATTARYVYLLYSGNYEVEGAGNQNSAAKAIYVYDWNGNPVKKLTCNSTLSSIAVTADDQMLYAYDIGKEQIVRAIIGQ